MAEKYAVINVTTERTLAWAVTLSEAGRVAALFSTIPHIQIRKHGQNYEEYRFGVMVRTGRVKSEPKKEPLPEPKIEPVLKEVLEEAPKQEKKRFEIRRKA